MNMCKNQDDREKIHKVMKAINAAWTKGRPEEIAMYFHDDIVIAHPNFSGRGEGKEVCVQSFVDFVSNAEILNYQESEYSIDIWGDTAVVTYSYQFEWEMNQEKHNEKGNNLYVFSRDNEEWRAVWRTIIPSIK